MGGSHGVDHVWAGLLNGLMITALGAAFPTLVVWRIAVDWPDVVSGRYDFAPAHVGQGMVVVAVSWVTMRFGVRLFRRHWTELVAQRREPCDRISES